MSLFKRSISDQYLILCAGLEHKNKSNKTISKILQTNDRMSEELWQLHKYNCNMPDKGQWFSMQCNNTPISTQC